VQQKCKNGPLGTVWMVVKLRAGFYYVKAFIHEALIKFLIVKIFRNDVRNDTAN